MTSRTITCDVRCLNADDVQRAKVLIKGEPFARVPYLCRVSGKSQELMLLTDATAENLAMALTPLSDPVTLKILYALGSTELCECDLSTLTECNDADTLERLEKLVRFGFLTRRQLHDMSYYALAEKGIESEDFLIRVLCNLSPAPQENTS